MDAVRVLLAVAVDTRCVPLTEWMGDAVGSEDAMLLALALLVSEREG